MPPVSMESRTYDVAFKPPSAACDLLGLPLSLPGLMNYLPKHLRKPLSLLSLRNINMKNLLLNLSPGSLTSLPTRRRPLALSIPDDVGTPIQSSFDAPHARFMQLLPTSVSDVSLDRMDKLDRLYSPFVLHECLGDVVDGAPVEVELLNTQSLHNQNAQTPNSQSLNSQSLNSQSLNSQSLNSQSLNGQLHNANLTKAGLSQPVFTGLSMTDMSPGHHAGHSASNREQANTGESSGYGTSDASSLPRHSAHSGRSGNSGNAATFSHSNISGVSNVPARSDVSQSHAISNQVSEYHSIVPEELQEQSNLHAYPNGPANVLNSVLYLYSDPSEGLVNINDYDLVINVARECSNLSSQFKAINDRQYMYVPWSHTLLILQELPRLTEAISRFDKPGKKILVHCQCGVLRSACVIVAYFMVKFGISVNEAYELLKSGTANTSEPCNVAVAKMGHHISACDRICPNMSLIFELMDFGEHLAL